MSSIHRKSSCFGNENWWCT